MDREALASRIDHTVLGPATTPAAVERVVDEAATHGMNACVPPCYVPEARERFDGTLATVVGFPHGQHAPAVKAAEAERAWRAGADELDVVCNVGRLTAGQDDAVRAGLVEVIAATPLPVKVIVESALLSDAELHRVAEAAVAADAAMLKTSTGFAEGGATAEAVELLADYLPVKASGGVGSYETATTMLAAGAERIGTSSGVAVLSGALD